MYQVLFHIPVQAGWLPDFFPLPALVAAVFLLLAAGAWFAAPKEPFGVTDETWMSLAKWLAGFGVVVGVAMYFAGRWWPDGIPVHGFGMMLFLAFLACNFVAVRLGRDVTFMTVATGPNRGKDYLTTNYAPDERNRRAQDVIQDTAVILFVGGLLGARVTYLVDAMIHHQSDIHSAWDFLVALPMIWEGGIILYGSVFGGAVTYIGLYLYWYCSNARLDTLKLVDISAPTLAIGLCLGRLGCLLNGCCYGQVACADCAVVPIHFPLSAPSRYALVANGYQTATGFALEEDGVTVRAVAPHSAAANAGLRPGDQIVEANGKPVTSRRDLDDLLSMAKWPRGGRELTLEVMDPEGRKRQLSFVPYTIGLLPTQVYESISMFILFWMLLAYFPIKTRDGQVMALLMMCYGVHRYLNELLRNDPRPEGFESYTSVILVAAGAVFFLALWLWPRRKTG